MKLTVQSFALIVVAALSLQAFAHDEHDNKAHDKGKASAAKAVKGGFLGKGDGGTKKLTGNAMDPVGNYKIVRRRALEAEINGGISPHMFRATGISVYLENGGTLEHAQQIAVHESARTTKLYGELAADPKSRA
jgi:integrase